MSDSTGNTQGRGQPSEGGFEADTGTGPHIATTPSGGANQSGAASDGSNEMSYHGGDTGAGAGGLLPGRQEEAKAELAAEALDGDAVPSGTGRDAAQLADPGSGTPPMPGEPDPNTLAEPAAVRVNEQTDNEQTDDEQTDEDDEDGADDEGDQPVAPV